MRFFSFRSRQKWRRTSRNFGNNKKDSRRLSLKPGPHPELRFLRSIFALLHTFPLPLVLPQSDSKLRELANEMKDQEKLEQVVFPKYLCSEIQLFGYTLPHILSTAAISSECRQAAARLRISQKTTRGGMDAWILDVAIAIKVAMPDLARCQLIMAGIIIIIIFFGISFS